MTRKPLSGGLVLCVVISCALAAPPTQTHAQVATCSTHDARMALSGLGKQRRNAVIVSVACPRLNRDEQADLVAVVVRGRRGGETRREWLALVRRSGRWKLVGRGDAWSQDTDLRGRVTVRSSGRVADVRWRVTRAIKRSSCARLVVRRQRLGLRRQRVRVIERSGRRSLRCPATAPDRSRPCRLSPRWSPDIGVSTRRDLPPGTVGRVLPGTQLASVDPPHGTTSAVSDPESPHYPPGWSPASVPSWLLPAGPGALVRADAGVRFNGDGAAYRVAHDLSYFGLSPTSVGDFDGDGIEDLAQTAHWATVDGALKAGQVQLYFGRPRGLEFDPRRDVPDVIFYGSERQARLGIEVAPAGDLNSDGYDDLVMSAAFATTHLAAGGTVTDGGEAYVVYGGQLQRFGCPTKVRVEDIGAKVPGFVLEAGHDGTHRLGWTNTLDSGDFDGDGDSDLVLGSYDPNRTPAYAPFRARAYVVYGDERLPTYGRFRLGVGDRRIDETVIEMPYPGWTQGSTLFQTSFVGDLDRDGRDELAIAAGRAYSDRGVIFIFRGRPGGLPRSTWPVTSADALVIGQTSAGGSLRMHTVTGARPAGDVNGDGYPDVQVSARYAVVDRRIVGAVGILRGGPNIIGHRGFLSLDGIVIGAGPDVESIGMPGMNRGADMDGDGYADLLINDPYWRERIAGQRQQRGRLWLVRGGPKLPRMRTIQEAADLTVLADTRFPGLFGYQWNTGDWNGDGRPDIVVADHYQGDSERHDFPGASYVFFNGVNFDAP